MWLFLVYVYNFTIRKVCCFCLFCDFSGAHNPLLSLISLWYWRLFSTTAASTWLSFVLSGPQESKVCWIPISSLNQERQTTPFACSLKTWSAKLKLHFSLSLLKEKPWVGYILLIVSNYASLCLWHCRPSGFAANCLPSTLLSVVLWHLNCADPVSSLSQARMRLIS